MKSAFLILLITGVYITNCFGQTRVVTFEDLNVLQDKEPRPVAVLIQTSWCKFCHAMKNSLLKNKHLSGVMADKFYVVFLDAESKKNIQFAGRTFKYIPSGANTGVNELAKELGTINGQLAYPSLCFLNEKNEIIYQHSGFLGPKAIEKMVRKLAN